MRINDNRGTKAAEVAMVSLIVVYAAIKSCCGVACPGTFLDEQGRVSKTGVSK